MIKLKDAYKNFVANLEEEGKSPATIIAYGKDIEQLTDFLEREGVALVNEIELEHLETFMQRLANSGYTPKSISRKTNATKTFFRFLHSMGHIVDNVADRLKHPKVEVKAPRILSKLEYRALRDSARGDARSYAMIETMLQTGVTISELAEMQIAHLEMSKTKGTLFVPKKNNKDARNIPLNKAVIDAISLYMNKHRPQIETAVHVFITKSGNALLVRNIRSTINRYFALAGVEHAKVNDLRHTFVAHHLSNGVSLLHLSKIAGHKRVSTTERYLQYIERVETEGKTELTEL